MFLFVNYLNLNIQLFNGGTMANLIEELKKEHSAIIKTLQKARDLVITSSEDSSFFKINTLTCLTLPRPIYFNSFYKLHSFTNICLLH